MLHQRMGQDCILHSAYTEPIKQKVDPEMALFTKHSKRKQMVIIYSSCLPSELMGLTRLSHFELFCPVLLAISKSETHLQVFSLS